MCSVLNVFCIFLGAVLLVQVNESSFSRAVLAWTIMESFYERICEAFTQLSEMKIDRNIFHGEAFRFQW